MANSCVAAIRQGASLYKQAKESFLEVKAAADEVVGIYKEVTGFWSNFSNFFKPKKSTPKPVAKARKKEKFVAYTETQAAADIVKQLTEFFALQDQLNEYLRAEELKAEVYDPNMSNAEMMGTAMNVIMCRQQMMELEVTIREIMVYETPGLADLYTQTFELRGKMQEQQTKARLAQEAQDRRDSWLHREKEKNLKLKIAYLLATSFLLLYVWLWLIVLSRWQKT
jgi:hypothetical protein